MNPLGQLSFHLPLAERYRAEEFIAAPSNQAALAWLARPAAPDSNADWPAGRLALWGPAGCGKTHLLRVWAEREAATVLDGAALGDLPDAPLGPIALDEADAAPELGLLRLINMCAESGHRLLLAARRPPGRWSVALPDLASRLRATTAAEIEAAEDALLAPLLAHLFRARQLRLPEPLAAFLLRRLPRTPAAMRQAAARLDDASLAAGRPITTALARQALADLLEASEDDAADEQGGEA